MPYLNIDSQRHDKCCNHDVGCGKRCEETVGHSVQVSIPVDTQTDDHVAGDGNDGEDGEDEEPEPRILLLLGLQRNNILRAKYNCLGVVSDVFHADGG